MTNDDDVELAQVFVLNRKSRGGNGSFASSESSIWSQSTLTGGALTVEGPDANQEPYRPATSLAPCLVTSLLVLGVNLAKVQKGAVHDPNFFNLCLAALAERRLRDLPS